MRHMTYGDFTWKNFWSILIGIALSVIIFLFSFVLPAYIEYRTRPETGLEDMAATYMIYTAVSALLFYVALQHNLWFNKKSTFIKDVLAVAIGLNCILWGFMFIMSFPK